MSHQLPDIDPGETAEWIDSFDAVVDAEGRPRARFLLMKLLERALSKQVDFPATVSSPYVNTIPRDQEPWFPGDEYLERRIRAYIRWNAAVMVIRANHRSEGIGGHLATYASSASLYEVGFNHFFRGKSDGGFGDMVFFQGHASPGIYGRAYVEGRLSEDQLDHFRQEVSGAGLPSYPHPRLLPDFWEYPTVSMGLGPLTAIYQAHVNRYLLHREIADTSASRVWCFVGDGELDEVDSTGALSVAGREHLDNLTFVVNCNLQRLDGPVRGNGKIIQEAEATFRGAGWNVIKVVWGSKWDELLARDIDGVLLDKMNTTPDGQFQKYATESGAYAREHFFGPDPRLRRIVEHLSDAEIQALPRGGHDYRKLYAAYKLATDQTNQTNPGQPTVILAKTVKGWTLGPEIEARNATHQIKKMTKAQLLVLRDRLYLQEEIPDEALDADQPPYYRPPVGSAAHEYLTARRQVLAGPLPSRVVRPRPAQPPQPTVFSDLTAGSGTQPVSTTMAFARLLRNLVRDPAIGRLVAPIVPDEARTFGLEPLIAETKIYAPEGQLYTPVDSDLILRYAEDKKGQVLEEGITEAGSMASFIALSTAYATWGQPMLPIYLFYSMFGFQRTGDLMWLLGDIRGRGILAGCTAGRTTLQGEGLQHDDGHSPLLSSVNPAARIYDPAFAYEIAVIMQEAVTRTLGPEPEDRFWYLTLYNENYVMPPLPSGEAGATVRAGILRGIYRFAGPADVSSDPPGSGLAALGLGDPAAAPTAPSPGSGAGGPEADTGIGPGAGRVGTGSGQGEIGRRRATLLFSGPMWRAAMEARDILARDWSVSADVWSVTSYTELRNDALSAERANRLHPGERARTPFVTESMAGGVGPVVAVTDYLRAVPDQVSRWVGRPFTSLGTDGFGRSDTRAALRRFFEVDAAHIVVAVLAALAQEGDAKTDEVAEAIATYGIDPDASDPWAV
jgi:pyruvate dehydrogenase E1 component